MVNRRQALTGVGGAGIVLALVAAGFREEPVELAAAGAGAAAPAPTTITFTYRNHTITITISGNMVMAKVDDRPAVHVALDSLRRFHSHLLPFSDYTDPRKMLTDLVDMHERKVLAL